MPFDGRLVPPDEFLVPAEAFRMPSDESPARSEAILVRPDEFRMPVDWIRLESLEWLANNMVSWFSQRITVGESDWAQAFARTKIDGLWSYKPTVATNP